MKYKKADQSYYYFDIGCGPGSCKNLFRNALFGSPIQYLQTIKKTGIESKAYFFEKDKYCCKQLRNGFTKTQGNFKLIEGDAKITLPGVIETLNNKFKTGLIYMDHNGTPNFNLLKYIANNNKTKCLDILINVPIGGHKRTLGYQKNNPSQTYDNPLQSLNKSLKIKKSILYKGPKPGPYRWTLFYLTNGPIPKWEKEGWFPYDRQFD